uniref:Reverse transcriptase domain-containing protein n=1 Tax=Oryzias latipes TaxID=8090 RepID=A0A3P9JRC9_ORYLA
PFALNSVLNEKASRSLFSQKQRLYEYGNKPSKYLARILNQKDTQNTIGAIRDSKGTRHYDRHSISSVFVSFYKSLYKSENVSTKEDMDRYFSQIKLPTLSEEAISPMHSGKSPGPDGFPVEWFKAFKDRIVPYLLRTYNYSFNTVHRLPETMTQANICLILKKGKDAEDPASYRPISLINVDVKILAKILSLRLESFITLLIKPDQTGLLNIIQQAQDKKMKGLLVSLDSLKAFDRVEWSYLFQTMDMFKLGANFVDWVKLLYSSPKEAVITNSHCSNYFFLERGTRQGCPLSPLLFALAIETFAELIRTSLSIKGFHIDGTEHKISLYADDVLLYLIKTDSTIPHLLNLLKQFRHISGFKVNLSKSEAMPIGTITGSAPPTGFPFQWSPKTITYLGIQVSLSLNKLLKLNLKPTIKRIREDLERWKSLPVSWLGRISVLKMNILPRLMYPLQMLPNSIPNSWFSDLDKIFTRYLWQGKKVRMKLSKL